MILRPVNCALYIGVTLLILAEAMHLVRYQRFAAALAVLVALLCGLLCTHTL